jgi:hypothetical protein
MLNINNSPTARSTLGFKHKEEFRLNRSSKFNPMFGKSFSKEFINMQYRNKKSINKPQLDFKNSADTIAKLIKLVYIYDF